MEKSPFACVKVAEKFTLMVEAIDHGEVVSLSSSTTVVIHVRDGNNHLPVFSDQTVGSQLVLQTPNSTSFRSFTPVI